MTDAAEDCPGGLRLHEYRGERACGRPSSGGASCHSIKYPSFGIEYSRVCGKVLGYQFGGPEAVGTADTNIDTHYVDGVSLTRGSPRQHIWTFMGTATENWNSHACPCATGKSNNVPSFFGNDYYCESAQTGGWGIYMYTGDRLWDGQHCRHLETPCCTSSDLPWFDKQLGETTSDYIEVRVCGNEGTGNEDTPIEQLDIYVQ